MVLKILPVAYVVKQTEICYHRNGLFSEAVNIFVIDKQHFLMATDNVIV